MLHFQFYAMAPNQKGFVPRMVTCELSHIHHADSYRDIWVLCMQTPENRTSCGGYMTAFYKWIKLI